MQATEMFPSFQFPVQVTIDGRTLDYLLTVDETGHVFEAVPTVFELPLLAQKLILGQTDGQLERKIRAYTRLFKYLVPLALVRKLPTYQEVLTPLVEEIERRLQERGMKLQDLPDASLASTLALQALSVFDENKKVSLHLVDVWTTIASILENLTNGHGLEEIRKLGYYQPEPAGQFFPAIIPFLDIHRQGILFEYLGNSKAKSPKHYLLQELAHPFSPPYAAGIFNALNKRYELKDEEVYDAVIQFYDRNPNLDEDVLGPLIDLLMNYPTPRTKEIGLEILKLNKSYSANYAARTLLAIGTNEKEIVDVLMPGFEAADGRVSEAAFNVFCNRISGENLPKAQETLDVFVKIMSKARGVNIFYCMPIIAEKNGLYLLTDQLFDLLVHEAPAIREGVLILIDRAEHKKNVPIEAYRTPEMVARFLELVYDSNMKVAEAALHLLSQIGREQKTAIYIDHFLKIIAQNPQEIILRLEAMRAINETLYHVPYQNQIEPIYLTALEESNYNFRVAALNGFRHSPNESFKRTLQTRFQEDPQQEVRSAANNLFPSPLRIFKDPSKKTPGILGRISAFLEDFLSI